MGKVRFGLSNCHYALYDAEKSTFATPVAIPGAVKLEISPEGDTKGFNADNITYYTSTKNGGYTGSIEIAAASDQMLEDLLGFELDESGALVEFADCQPKQFALMYEVDGDPTKQRGVLFNCKLSRPKLSPETTSDTAEPQTISFDFSASAIEVEYKGETRYAIKSSIESTTTGYADFFKAVKLPSKAAA